MDIYILNHIADSSWWDTLVTASAGFFGVIIGAFLAYYLDKKLQNREIENSAYTSAILIRGWLIEKLSNVTALKMRFKLMHKIVRENTAEQVIRQYHQGKDENFKLLIAPFLEKPSLYDLDSESLKSLSLLRERFDRFEAVLQCISFVLSMYSEITELKRRANELRESMFNGKDMASNEEEMFKKYFNILKFLISGWLDTPEKIEGYFKDIFECFQILICNQLGIKSLKLSPNAETQENLIKELLDYAKNKSSV